MGHSRSHACLRVGETSIAPNGFTPALTAPWAFVAADRFLTVRFVALNADPCRLALPFGTCILNFSAAVRLWRGRTPGNFLNRNISRSSPDQKPNGAWEQGKMQRKKGPMQGANDRPRIHDRLLTPPLSVTRENARCGCVASSIRPQIRREYPLNLSISLSGGKETN